MDIINSIKEARSTIARAIKNRFDECVAMIDQKPEQIYVNSKSADLSLYCQSLKKELSKKL